MTNSRLIREMRVLGDPGGVVDISRRLSEATPPERDACKRTTPEGSQVARLGVLAPLRGATLPTPPAGGIALLNHRLISATPPG